MGSRQLNSFSWYRATYAGLAGAGSSHDDASASEPNMPIEYEPNDSDMSRTTAIMTMTYVSIYYSIFIHFHSKRRCVCTSTDGDGHLRSPFVPGVCHSPPFLTQTGLFAIFPTISTTISGSPIWENRAKAGLCPKKGVSGTRLVCTNVATKKMHALRRRPVVPCSNICVWGA